MKILVLGSGAREHAIVHRLLQDSEAHTIVAAPGNAGIATEAICVPLNDSEPADVAEWLREHPQDLVIVGPEAPLIAGVADAVRALDIPVFGPNANAAQLEGSKTFAKDVMTAANVPTGGAIHITKVEDAQTALEQFGAPYVVKADGLAAGKGVLVTSDIDAAMAHVRKWIDKGSILIEEFLDGREVSLFFLSDGTHVAPLDPGQDYKRLGDGDAGPNTGGMGAYSPLPWLPDGFVADVQHTIAEPVISELKHRGTPFVGLLYCGLILTATGIKVIEFNARFGDPETLVILPRLVGEFGQLLVAAATGQLDTVPAPAFDPDLAAVAVVIASEGYPVNAQAGRDISGIPAANALPDVTVIHAATAQTKDQQSAGVFTATGGRVLDVVATAKTLEIARARAYDGVAAITLVGAHHRTDIANRVSA